MIYEDLYHHGIKGMRWGVRRFQRTDGSLTPAGKKRYDQDDKPESALKKQVRGHREKLVKKYREKGLSEVEARKAAAKRIKIENTIAITAGVTVAAAAAWYAKNKWVNTYCDQVLKSGTTFHNLDSAANPRPGEHLYVTYRRDDRNFFNGHFAVNKMHKTGHVFEHVVTAKDDVKIPSMKTRKSVFKQLYDNDADFRAAFNENTFGVSEPTKIPSKLSYAMMWGRFGNKDTPEFNVAKRKYFEALKQKGYDAIVDEWDTKRGVFRSNAPLILLDTSSKSFGKMTISELTSKDILLAQAASKNWHTGIRFKNAAMLPHTNHFKESAKQLAKTKTKMTTMSSDIDKVMSGLSEGEIRSLIRARKGSIVASAGKYMSKNSNLSVAEAMTKAKKNHAAVESVVNNTVTALGVSTIVTPLIAYKNAKTQTAVNQYIAEHPNTKKSVAEIEQMIVDQQSEKQNKKRRR